MGKGGGSAPSPDPRIGKAAMKQAETGEQWLAFAKDSYKVSTERQAELDKLTKEMQGLEIGSAKDQLAWSRESRQRYKDKFLPIEDNYIKQVEGMDSAPKLAAAAAEAQGDVQAQAANARGTAARTAQGIGINPTSGRYAGIEKAGELTTGLSAAGAANSAREGQRDKAIALRGGLMDFGRGLSTSSVAASQAGVNAANAVVQQGQGNQQLSNASSDIVNSGFAGAQQGYAGQASTLNNLYANNLDRWRIQQEANSANITGMFGALGTVAGAAITSDPKLKKNVKSTKKGSGLEAVKKMPIKEFDYKPGAGDGGKGHTGPMAPAFAKATGQKDTGLIRVQDAIGITMKAIQDLDAKVDALGTKPKGKAKPKAKSKPAERRPSQSPAKARMVTAKPAVKAQSFGIRRA